MRTKTLLLSAAAMAAGLLSSQAQNVYSANIVGYMNVVTIGGSNTPVVNPFDLDGDNNVTNVLANAPKGTTVQIWNGAGFTLVSRGSFGAGAWSSGASHIPPGTGFFLNTPSTFTNTFVGSVVPANGASNNLALTAGQYQFVGSVLPISGTVTNPADQGANTLNLGSVLPKGTVIQVWNGNGYTLYSRGSFGAGAWSGNPTISAGQAFFVNSPIGTNWQQSLSLQ